MSIVSQETINRQLAIEMESVQIGVTSYREALKNARTKGGVESMKPEAALIRQYMNPYLSGFRGEVIPGDRQGLIKFIRVGHGRVGAGVMSRKYIKDIDPMEVAFIVLRTVFNSIHTPYVPILGLAKKIGAAVNDHAGYLNFKNVNPQYFKNVEKFVRMKTDDQKRIVIKNRANTQEASEFKSWGEKAHKSLGMKLLSMLCTCTNIGDKQTIYQGQGKLQGKGTAMFVPNAEVVSAMEDAHEFHEIRQPMHMPMIMPPMDWTSEVGGGHLGQEVSSRYKLVGRNFQSHRADPQISNLEPIMEACNKLQSVPWVINTKMLDIIKTIRDNKGGMAGIVPLDKDILFKDAPVKPWATDEEMENIKTTNYDLYKKTMRPYMLRHEAWARNVSKRSSLAKQIMIAERYLNEEAMYFCYTAEWRGRINCKQSHVSPQANDTGKSLIMLKNGLPIGNDPLAHSWFKRQGAGCFAEQTPEIDKAADKLTYTEREAWVDRHAAEICADAINPWRPNALWLQADKCLTYLAWTFEYAAWVESGYSPEFVNHIPSAQDGSCSGLQHISGMLKDEVCAVEVNLTSLTLPKDIYGKVAEVGIPMIELDAQAGNLYAKAWLGKMDRGVTKAAVMTFVYGAKERTNVKQLLELLQKYEDKGKVLISIDQDEKFKACCYMKDIISKAMRLVIVKGTQFMDWMQEVAKLFGKADAPMMWTTPDGVQIVMSYREQDLKQINTYWGGTRFSPRNYQSNKSKIANGRMKNGIAANYIHSYDACHLRTVINEFGRAGLNLLDGETPDPNYVVGPRDIVVIHDSFAALPCVSAELHRTLQRTFMELYSNDQIARFISEIQPLIEEEIPAPPCPGTWNPSEMLQADYSFG